MDDCSSISYARHSFLVTICQLPIMYIMSDYWKRAITPSGLRYPLVRIEVCLDKDKDAEQATPYPVVMFASYNGPLIKTANDP